MKDFGLYVIMTDPAVGYEKFLEVCVEERMPYVQLRDKSMSDGELLATAKRLADIVRATETRLIINDRPDIALLSGAHGYHLGRGDLPLAEARRLASTGTTMIAGLSSHSPAQAEDAVMQKPDYIGFGPVYPTPTKAIPDPAVGLSQIGTVVAGSSVPVVVLGGLFPEHIQQVIDAGARNVCCVRYLNEAEHPGERIREINRMMRITA